jgi:hypothetical protein
MKEALKAVLAVTCLLGGAALIAGGLPVAAFDVMYMAWGSVVGSGRGRTPTNRPSRSACRLPPMLGRLANVAGCREVGREE